MNDLMLFLVVAVVVLYGRAALAFFWYVGRQVISERRKEQ